MSNTNLCPFFDLIEDIPSKNAGGCLFFVYVFWLWLKHNDLPTESFAINQYDWHSGVCAAKNMEWIATKGSKAIAASSKHFTWTYEGEEYDADGEYEDPAPKTELAGLNTPHCNLVDRFCQSALGNGEWNTWFDRDGARKILKERFCFEIPA